MLYLLGALILLLGFELGWKAQEWIYTRRVRDGKLVFWHEDADGGRWIGQPAAFLSIMKGRR
jgi:hypothetical protein